MMHSHGMGCCLALYSHYMKAFFAKLVSYGPLHHDGATVARACMRAALRVCHAHVWCIASASNIHDMSPVSPEEYEVNAKHEALLV